MQYTDLILLDIKHIDEKEHIRLTGHTNKNILDLATYLSDMKKLSGSDMFLFLSATTKMNIWTDCMNSF